MKSFFKKETKEDKERKRQKKHGDLSFNNTSSPDYTDQLDLTNEIHTETTQTSSDSTQASTKLQSNSHTSIDSQASHPPLLPKPKKGILKTMSKFGIGPTLANLSSSSTTPNTSTSISIVNQTSFLRNTSTNLPMVSSPKQIKHSPQSKLLIENSIPNYTKRNSQVMTGHILNEFESFVLPTIRKIPDVVLSKTCDSSHFLNSLVRCVSVSLEQLQKSVEFFKTEQNTIVVTCNLPNLPFLPGDELISINDFSAKEKNIPEIIQFIQALINLPQQNISVYVRTAMECSEIIFRNNSNGIFKINRPDSASLNLMNSTLGDNLQSNLDINVNNEKDLEETAWLMHSKGYSLVTVISKLKSVGLNPDALKFKVRLENGNMIEVNEEDLEKINPGKYDFCEDLSQLQFINESSLIHTLRQRFQTLSLKHSYIGSSSLFVLSPGGCLSDKGIYSDRMISVFKGCKMDEMPPHIYSYTQNVYRNMLSTQQDQSIVLMGHSGSGKSENSRHILNYLFKVTSHLSSGINNNLTEDKLDAMFNILNAFCSIKTEKNPKGANRFLNIFLLEFNHSGQIASILLQLIPLDYTRLLYQPNGESNFQVFYYLLFGSESGLKTDLQLPIDPATTEPNIFFQSPTNAHRHNAIPQFSQLLSAFATLGFKNSEIKTLLSILASIYHLGQAGAMPTTANSRYGQFTRPNEAHKAANLLGVSFQQLNDNIFCNVPSACNLSHTKYGHLSNNGSAKVSPTDANSTSSLSPLECLEGFCLGMYQEALNLLTNLINGSFKNTSNVNFHHQQSISNSMLIVDPPGFQYQNSDTMSTYSDLMCNYLSERLQLLFYQINFINPIEKCAQEGLDIDLVEHIPESPSQLVNWFDKPVAPAILSRTVNTIQLNGQLKAPVSNNNCGLLWLLEDQISSGKKSVEIFMRKLFESDQKQNFISVKSAQEEAETVKNFMIHHQFGQFPVEYDVSKWLEEYCKEYVTQSNAMVVLQQSKKDAISSSIRHNTELSNQYNIDTNKSGAFSLKRQASVRKMLTMSKRKTFNVNFKLQLDSIFDSMRRTKCHFVFCSLAVTKAPDTGSGVNLLDVNLLRRQLKAYQVLAACRIYRQGYPDYLNLEDFERKFSMFLPAGTNENAQNDIADTHKKACINILSSLELDSTLFKFGITQIFFKAGVLARLDEQREKKLNSLIVRLQSKCRMYLAQRAIEKRRVQDSAIRCIQKNNTELMYKQCKEELEEFRRKNERLTTEKNNLLVLNNQLENKFLSLQSEYIEEHSANNGTADLLEAETNERIRLDKDLSELKLLHNDALKKIETIESEMLELRFVNTKQQLEGEMKSSNDPLDMASIAQIEKLKSENQNLKKQLLVNKDNDETYRVKERSFFENKLKDKDNELIETEKAVTLHKRKYQKLNEEIQDIQRLCDGLKIRNNELEKIQKKFDYDMNSVRASCEIEKELKEKCERERDMMKYELQAVGEQLSAEKMERAFLVDKCARMEHDLKEYETTKYDTVSCAGTGSADQFIKLKNQIRDMETKINDQEEELDDQQGAIQQLEQTKLRLQMQLEKEKSKWQREIAEKESEMDDLRFHTQKKIKAIEMQLEEESEISSSLQREKRELERKLKEFGNVGNKSTNFIMTLNSHGDADTNSASIADYIAKLKRQMQKYKMLAIDAQTQLEKLSESIPKQSIMKALKSQLEDSEITKASALKAKQMLQCELNELQTELEENIVLRQNLEEQNMHLNRDLINLKSQLEEQERDTDEMLKKYQSQIQSNSVDSHHFIDLNNQIDVMGIENRMLKEKIRGQEEKISLLETTWIEKSTLNKVESRIRELECKLDLEVTQKQRLQGQLERVKQQYEKAISEADMICIREKKVEESLKKSQRQNKETVEEFGDLQKKVIDLDETRKRLENQNEILERELEAAKGDIRVNLTRLEAFQNAFSSMNDEVDSESETTSDDYCFGDEDIDCIGQYDQNVQLTCE